MTIIGKVSVLAALSLAFACALPVSSSQADERPGAYSKRYGTQYRSRAKPYRVAPGAGGYSLTLSDIWGPAEMPPTPRDFGPHFDFQPSPLHGGVGSAPYPGDY